MRIPAGENLGLASSQPVRQLNSAAPAQASADAFGGGVARAITGLGTQVRQLENEEARQARVEMERQAQIAEAADKSRALTQLQNAQDDLELKRDHLLEGVRTGEVPIDKANEDWGILSKDALTPALEGTPTQHREAVQRDLERYISRSQRDVTKAVTVKHQADIRTSIDTIFESTQRQYLTDPAKAEQRLTATIDSLGPYSGLTTEQIATAKQNWMEGTRFNKATTLVTAAKRSNAELSAVEKALSGEEFASLDPQRRAALAGQIETFKTQNEMRAEAAARRAQAAQEHKLKVAEAEINAARMLTDEGKMLNEAAAEKLMQATQGTPYAEVVPQMLREARGQTSFGMQSLDQQAQALDAYRSELTKNGTDADSEKRFARLETIYKAKEKSFKDNPMKALVDYGLVESIPPLDMSSIPAALNSLQQRVGLAALAETQKPKGMGPVSLLQPDEAPLLAEAISVLPIADQAKAAQQIVNAIGPKQASAFAKQVEGKDKALSLAMQVEDAGAAEMIMRGSRALREKSVKQDSSEYTSPRKQVVDIIGDAFPNEQMREDIIEAASLISYGQKSAGGNASVKKALQSLGVNVIKHNGSPLPIPKDMDDGDFEDRLDAALPQIKEQVEDGNVYLDGQPVAAEVFAKQLPNLKLRYVSKGRYAVETASGIATTAQRKPLIIKVQ